MKQWPVIGVTLERQIDNGKLHKRSHRMSRSNPSAAIERVDAITAAQPYLLPVLIQNIYATHTARIRYKTIYNLKRRKAWRSFPESTTMQTPKTRKSNNEAAPHMDDRR
jgi:hypothetical protein